MKGGNVVYSNLNVSSETNILLPRKINHPKYGFSYYFSNDILNEKAMITSAFAAFPSSSFVTPGLKPNPWISRASVGFSHKITDATEIMANYDVEHRENFWNQTASVKAKWAF
jgi:hypothetical protein